MEVSQIKGTPMAAKKKAAKKKAAPAKAMTRTEVVTALAEGTGLSKKEVSSVFDELGELMGKNLGRRGPGVFNLAGLMKVKVVRKPATKARKGINPFTKEETMFKAKPARNVVKILPLKGLKDMV
jgi:nucleoid DNA-binding protein